MTERPKGTRPYIAETAGEGPPYIPARPGIENEHPVGPEVGLQERQVSSLSPAELLELKQYLGIERIDIRRETLGTEKMSAGYKKVVIMLEGGKIAFRPNQNNLIITGTRQEFLAALKTVDETL